MSTAAVTTESITVTSKPEKRRASSNVPGVFNILDLVKKRLKKLEAIFHSLIETSLESTNFLIERDGTELEIAVETQKLEWRINKSPSSLDEPAKSYLRKMLTTPPVKKIDLHFPLGLEVTARNLRGVTIKDAVDAIYKQFRKKADDELERPFLAGFEWDKEESWTRLIVHCKKEGASAIGGKKHKKNNSH